MVIIINLWLLIILVRIVHYIVRRLLIFLYLVPTFLIGQKQSVSSITTEDGLSQGMIFDILKDKDGFLWFATKNGLNRYDGYNFKIFTHDPFDSLSVSGDVILSILEDSGGRFWVNTESNGLNYFDKEKEVFYPVKINQKETHDFQRKNRSQSSLSEDMDGNIWMWEKSSLIKIIVNDFEQQLKEGFSVKQFSNIESVFFDKKGRPWVNRSESLEFFTWSSQEEQMVAVSESAYNTAEDKQIQQKMDLQSLIPKHNQNFITKIFEENEHTTWVGTNGFGIRQVINKPTIFRHLMPKQSIRYIREYESERMAVLSYLTPSILNGDNGDFSTLPPRWTGGFLKSQAGGYWVGVNAFRKVEPEQGILTKLDEDLNVVKQYPYHYLVRHYLIEDVNGNLWTAPERADFAQVSLHKDSVHFVDCSEHGSNAEKGYPQCLYIDGENNLWKGQTTGLMRLVLNENQEPVDCQFYQSDPKNPYSLRNNSVSSCLDDPIDPSTYLWVGTKGGGLNKLNKKTGQFEHFTTKDGLPDNVVYGILKDEQDNLWVSTNKGLSQFNPAQSTFKNYRKSDGLQEDEFNTNAYFKNEITGELFFGGINGITAFHPEDIRRSDKNTKVYITTFKIHNEDVNVGQALKERGENPLTKSIEYTEKIDLSWHQNQLTFQFASLDYDSPESNQYKYKLTGVNQNWVTADESRIANYSNLGVGKYVFEVMGSNSNGVWNEEVTQLEISIYPPWWRTWWAYLTYLALAVLAIFQMYQFQIRRGMLHNQLLFEQKEAERLAEVDKIKTNFFTNITHEFRTPLTLIIEPLRQLLNQNLSQEVQSDVHLAKKNSERLLNLVNQLLDVSKLEAKKMKVDLVKGDVMEIIHVLFDSFQSIANQKGIQLHLNRDTDIEPFYFDKSHLEKILYNLLSNAMKFTNSGSVTVSVQKKTKDSVDEIQLIVEDTGIGISDEQIDHIFNRFYQAENTGIKRQSGTGVGLALVKELVELQGGEISVKSKIGDGTRFTVLLPFISKGDVVASQEYISQNEFIEQNYTEDLEVVHNHTPDENDERALVLIVEDNPELRAFIRRQIESNYQVIEAENGVEGIDMAVAHTPDLIISDVMMPLKTGYELVENLKNDITTSHIPIILLTAKTAIESKLQGLKQGADDYLTKPFNTEEILIRIANLIEIRLKLQAKFSEPLSLIKTTRKEKALSEMDAQFITQTKANIEENLSNDSFSVEALAGNLFMSRSQLFRKLKALTGQSPNEFIRNYRLDHAMDKLKTEEVKIIQLAFSVGFSDEKYFSKCFKNRFKLLPSEVLIA